MSIYTRKGSPYFYYDLVPQDGGPRIQKSTKIRHDAPTPDLRRENRRLAEKVYHEAFTEAIRRREGLEDPIKSTETFKGFAAWYLTHVAAHHRGKERETEIVDGLVKVFGRQLLADVSKASVQEWMTVRRKAAAASTVNRELDVLKAMLAAAVPKYLKASPIAGLKRLRPEKRAMAILSHEDEAKVAAALLPADRAILIAALDTLLRASDLMRLTWRHDHGSYLDVVDPKTGKGYKVPVSTRLRAALTPLKRKAKGKGPIFRHRRKASTPRLWSNSLKQMLEDACERAGVAYGRAQGAITFHSLRHTGASRMIDAGVSVRVVQAIGGWSDLRQLTRYTHPSDPALLAAVEAVSRPVSRATGEPANS